MEPLPRPMPSRGIADRTRDWLTWIGTTRLLAASVATVIVCTGGWWLLRAPAPPTEASLPRASTTTADAGVTTSTTVTTEPPRPVVVHVAGAVAIAGVYELPPGARVIDAVVAAGGPLADAATDALNLAASLADGSRVYVPVVGEEVAGALVTGGGPAVGEASEALPSGPLNVNQATAADLESLPGVGPATATAIVTERERNGPFLGVDDLLRVPGIGPAKLAALRDLVTT